MREIEQIIIESTECSTCDACPGEPCYDGKGVLLDWPHQQRVETFSATNNEVRDV